MTILQVGFSLRVDLLIFLTKLISIGADSDTMRLIVQASFGFHIKQTEDVKLAPQDYSPKVRDGFLFTLVVGTEGQEPIKPSIDPSFARLTLLGT